VYLTNYF
jgi:serine/threonine protein kinase